MDSADLAGDVCPQLFHLFPQALHLGALQAGERRAAGYPTTPSACQRTAQEESLPRQRLHAHAFQQMQARGAACVPGMSRACHWPPRLPAASLLHSSFHATWVNDSSPAWETHAAVHGDSALRSWQRGSTPTCSLYRRVSASFSSARLSASLDWCSTALCGAAGRRASWAWNGACSGPRLTDGHGASRLGPVPWPPGIPSVKTGGHRSDNAPGRDGSSGHMLTALGVAPRLPTRPPSPRAPARAACALPQHRGWTAPQARLHGAPLPPPPVAEAFCSSTKGS